MTSWHSSWGHLGSAQGSYDGATKCVGGPKGTTAGTSGVGSTRRNSSRLRCRRYISSGAAATRKNGQHCRATRRSRVRRTELRWLDQGTWPKFGYRFMGHIVPVAGWHHNKVKHTRRFCNPGVEWEKDQHWIAQPIALRTSVTKSVDHTKIGWSMPTCSRIIHRHRPTNRDADPLSRKLSLKHARGNNMSAVGAKPPDC